MKPVVIALCMGLLAGALSAAAATTFSVSNVFGSNMVLQRDVSATLWGFAEPGTLVKTTIGGTSLTTQAGKDSVWRQALPVKAAGGPYTITASAGSDTVTLSNVLFGDVYICSGQSNMQFTVPQALNASAEIEAANGFPSIRVMTVGQGTTSNEPLSQLATIEQVWAEASAASIGGGNWTHFSAVCWFFGRDLYTALGGAVPIGLISSNWGGTRIQAWSSPTALKVCNTSAEAVGVTPNQNDPSVLWNAMIVPFTIGPLSLKGFTWFQGTFLLSVAPRLVTRRTQGRPISPNPTCTRVHSRP
jgi:sialate O-acetylesterase